LPMAFGVKFVLFMLMGKQNLRPRQQKSGYQVAWLDTWRH